MWKIAAPLLLTATLVACGDDADVPEGGDVAEFTYRELVVKIDDAVTVWNRADSPAEAQAAAEAAANLVVGPGGPGYGDRDGNGNVDGETEFGVLPGLDGSPVGLANALGDNECIVNDVLGGSWDAPADRWATMQAAIDAWSFDNDTMPSLASQMMQIVGWATLTLGTDSIDETFEFGRLAQQNVDASLAALDCTSAG
jgi:hypothetical protein